ncbi:hypothetical protein NDK47_11750 [Brevibacillus ruminantium]|uniref:Squalene cyclase C-terminal domain-containing protein n=1 Tax=Brevibacillus ruminantium TaxID=2950604 RepID=A0ABY4WL61_9BACL|nr:hypothetical protein [Brevibacillus ruminantium]USG67903.1 hypothetical protein NDK47_11750 [Brevibacillus ruminantium]
MGSAYADSSDIVKSYVPLGASTPSQTAWAVDTLIAASPTPTTPMRRGIHFLLESEKSPKWTRSYPTDAALPGGFYFHYHSYRYICPCLHSVIFKRSMGNDKNHLEGGFCTGIIPYHSSEIKWAGNRTMLLGYGEGNLGTLIGLALYLQTFSVNLL